MRKKLFTQSVLAQISRWVREGLTPGEMARKIGCTVGTLRVRCSQEGVSLRIASKAASKERPDRGRRAKSARRPEVKLTVSVPGSVRDHLHARAASKGISEASLVTALIETIDKDDLYDAVLDDRIDLDCPRILGRSKQKEGRREADPGDAGTARQRTPLNAPRG